VIHIATFYAHIGAIRCKRDCEQAGWEARLMPVPRSLSSSCGTCVRYEGEGLYPCREMPEELEQIAIERDGGYVTLYRAEEGEKVWKALSD